MAKISERKKIDDYLSAQDQGLRDYFQVLPELLDKVSSSEPALAYCFQRIEMAQRVGLYVLLMREYRTNSALAWAAVDRVNITRTSFPDLFKTISGKQLPANFRDMILPAEKVRDAIMHGRKETKAQINQAILQCLKYAVALNEQFQEKCAFKPFGPLRGVTSKKGSPQLSEKISHAVLAGLKISSADR